MTTEPWWMAWCAQCNERATRKVYGVNADGEYERTVPLCDDCHEKVAGGLVLGSVVFWVHQRGLELKV